MVDRGMARGIMLKRRGKIDCSDCHFGKQRRKTFRKALDRPIERVNDMVFADLLIPGLNNGSRYTAVLVVMDGYSRYVKTCLLKTKGEREVNEHMMEYIAWAERQHGRRVDTVVTRQWNVDEELEVEPVRQVLTDKGQEFCNGTIERWYRKKGIVHTKVGPNASQLNLVERTHQTIVGMIKTMMHQAGLPKSFWIYALENAVYVKNRVFCKGAGRTPYELMFDSKPDIHHIRAFGSLAYCHTPKSKRKKLSMNCRVGFLLGYREDVVGCNVYFPTEHKTGFVSDVNINESIKYKDRYESGFKVKVDKWLRTFQEFFEDGELDDLSCEEEDNDSQLAECDGESERSVSDIVMESANGEGVNEEDQPLENDTVWDNTRQHGYKLEEEDCGSCGDKAPSSSNSLTSDDQALWEEMLQNTELPDYEDASETQEGESPGSVAAGSIDDLDLDEEIASDKSDLDDDMDDEELTGPACHVSDLKQLAEEEENSVEGNYGDLFDPSDEAEGVDWNDEHALVPSDEYED
ncbi:Integrase, catalytic core protein, partial [Phytophthora megakarya]